MRHAGQGRGAGQGVAGRHMRRHALGELGRAGAGPGHAQPRPGRERRPQRPVELRPPAPPALDRPQARQGRVGRDLGQPRPAQGAQHDPVGQGLVVGPAGGPVRPGEGLGVGERGGEVRPRLRPGPERRPVGPAGVAQEVGQPPAPAHGDQQGRRPGLVIGPGDPPGLAPHGPALRLGLLQPGREAVGIRLRPPLDRAPPRHPRLRRQDLRRPPGLDPGQQAGLRLGAGVGGTGGHAGEGTAGVRGGPKDTGAARGRIPRSSSGMSVSIKLKSGPCIHGP